MGHLNTHESFDYIWMVWRFVGIHPCNRFTWLYYIYSFIANLLGNAISPIFVFINVFFVDDIGSVMRNLQASPMLIIEALKQLAIFLKISNLKNIKFFTDQLDQRVNLSQDEVAYLRAIIKQCKYTSYAVQVILVLSLFSHAIPALLQRKLVFEGWFPFNWNASNINYYSAYSFQFLATAFQIVEGAADDVFPVVYINVLRGHIHALGMRVARIGRDPNKSVEENFTELKACIGDHQNIIRYFEIIKSVISLPVLMQFGITAFVLCISVVYYLIFNRGFSQLLSTLIYMGGILSVSFPICFIANELMAETEDLTSSIYDCNWMDQSPEFRKCVIIFMERSLQENNLKAGFVPINLDTYISIIRFSFSVFTVLSEVK